MCWLHDQSLIGQAACVQIQRVPALADCCFQTGQSDLPRSLSRKSASHSLHDYRGKSVVTFLNRVFAHPTTINLVCANSNSVSVKTAH